MRPELDMRAITVLITKSIDVTWIALLSSQWSSFTQQDEHTLLDGWYNGVIEANEKAALSQK